MSGFGRCEVMVTESKAGFSGPSTTTQNIDSSITLSRVFPGWYRYLIYGLLLLLPAAFARPSLLAAVAFLVIVSYAWAYDPTLLAHASLDKRLIAR